MIFINYVLFCVNVCASLFQPTQPDAAKQHPTEPQPTAARSLFPSYLSPLSSFSSFPASLPLAFDFCLSCPALRSRPLSFCHVFCGCGGLGSVGRCYAAAPVFFEKRGRKALPRVSFFLIFAASQKTCSMDEEARKKKRLYAGEKKPSMKRRLDGHDYSSRCIYLVTMVTEGRLPLFGKVVGDVHKPYGDPDAPHTVPTPLGAAIFDNWSGMLARFPEMTGIAFQRNHSI